jgi:hypothetical protein
MLQRVQSLYLLLGVLAVLALLLVSSLWQGVVAQTLPWFAPALWSLIGLTALAGLGAIFLYRNRSRQLQVVTGVHWLTVVLLAVLLAGFYLAGALPQITSSGEAGLLPPGLLVLAYVWFRLARRGIQRDIHLVRSVDRLRP